MLSLAKVTDAGAAASYYGEVDDYYFRGEAPTQWWGEGAARLKLTGEVDKDDFTRLLDGRMPDGSRMHVGGDGSRRAATDLTFSAPKSVSMQAMIGGDARLLAAHENAVKRTMAYVEQNLAGYRERHGETVTQHLSGNLIVAMVRHDVSRAVDPQLHTHCVVMNATETAADRWRALNQTPLYKQHKMLGALYRAELAMEVQRLGYGLRVTHADGRFELSHIAEKQIVAFSQRSSAIEAALAKEGKTRRDVSAHAKEKIALSTREAKGDINHADVMREWRDKSHALGIDYSPALVPREHSAPMRDVAAHEAMDYAVQHTTERESVVAEHRLLQAALERGVGRTDMESVQMNLVYRTHKGELLNAGERYTTQAAQQAERELLGVEWRGRGAIAPLMVPYDAARELSGGRLNAGQKAAATHVLTSENTITGIQGVAGAGKTTMLSRVRRLAKAQGYHVMGLAPSKAAVDALETVGIAANTIAAFREAKYDGLTAKTLVIVDEAGMVGTRDMHHILHRIEEAGARAVLVGDTRQLKAVAAGRPFAQLQGNGMATVKMQDIVRQHDAVLKRAVELAADGDIHRSIATLKKHIVEIDHSRERHAAMARDFAGLDDATRARTLIVAGSRSARAALNAEVRQALGLAGTGTAVAILEGRDLTEAQTRTARSYQPGEVVQAERHYPSLGLERGDLARVLDVAKSTVTLERIDGEQVIWTPREQPNFTAYTEQERELAVGDKLRFTKNDHSREIVNGETGVVTLIDAEHSRIVVEKSPGDSVTLSTDQPLQLDHGYASTVHASQGQTCERVMIEADTASVTACESEYYVAISRATDEAVLYTDDRALLPEAMDKADEKEAALDIKSERETETLEK